MSKIDLLKRFDAAEYLTDNESIEVYLEEVLKSGDPAYIAHALGTVARARGMAKVAKKSGLSRESLYKTLSAEGNPELGTFLRVLAALGLKLSICSAAPVPDQNQSHV